MRMAGRAFKRRFRSWAMVPWLAFSVWHCAPASSKMYVPDDLPDICREIDFRFDAALREVCGVETRNYMAYRNIPRHRSLLQPKGAKIIHKGKGLELRMENTLPIDLPKEFQGRIAFGEEVRRSFIASRMDYLEFFAEATSTQRARVLRLDVPVDNGELSVCYTVIPQIVTAQRKTGHATSLEPLNCREFEMLKQVHRTKMQAEFTEEE